MVVCCCSLAGTSACNLCPNNPSRSSLWKGKDYYDYQFPRTFTVTFSKDDDKESVEDKIDKIRKALEQKDIKRELDDLKKMQKDIDKRINDLEKKLQDKEKKDG